MKLKKLSSSNSKFRTLNFKPGLNIVSGINQSKQEKKTTNGIGKSFSLLLIHYIFGASTISPKDKENINFLKNYGSFQLDFEHNNKHYTVDKDFNNTCFRVNDVEFTSKDYIVELKRIFLPNCDEISFRQLFNVFARRFGGTYYADVLSQQGMPVNDYKQNFVNIYLTKLNTDFVNKNYSIKQEKKRLEEIKKYIITEQLSNSSDNVKDMQDRLQILKQRKSDFIIAENYNELKDKADIESQKLEKIRENIYIIKSAINRKRENLELSQNIDINSKSIKLIFQEAEFFFNEQVTKRLEETEQFHRKLIESRRIRLTEDINKLTTELEKMEEQRSQSEKKRDNLVKQLDERGALEEYECLSNQISDLEKEIQNNTLLVNECQSLTTKIAGLKLEDSKNFASSDKYLTSIESHLNLIEGNFRNLVKKFYDNQGGELKVSLKERSKYLFHIEPQVPKDNSEGIGSVKIFCYDVLLYSMNNNLLNFLAHDGCIFSGIDPRQKAKIFECALDLIKKDHDFQYFVNLDQESLNQVLDSDILNEDQKQLVRESQILKLSDKDENEFLFGKKFD